MQRVELAPEAIRDEKPYLGWGLTEAEYDRFTSKLGRLPNYTEIGLASGMWSEHCAYKYSKPVLKSFWTKNDRVLMGPGEGAGVIDIGAGKAVVFKAESHNHPSAVEPYEGAATGVGGIIRDIFSIGAEPIALLDSLSFGELDDPHVRHLVDQVVAGIGGYGNSIGIPTIGGETNFDATYARNPLVNAMCVGIMDKEQIQRGRAAGVGNAIIYVGAKTGRDGINGASFASSEFADDKQADRAAVQVGDPFMEKLLTDACLEVTRQHRDALVGMQDMGAAGLISSSVEMADKAGAGMTLNLDLIPQREPGMIPFEIMLSESQERMLLCVRAGSEQEIIDVFTKYGLDAVVCGHVTAELRYKLTHHGHLVCDVPVSLLASDAPVYHQQGVRPARLDAPQPAFVPEITDARATWLTLLGQSTIADKSSLYRRYDAQVKTNTVVLPGSDAGVVRIRGTRKALAVTTDSNGRYLYLHPERGGAMVVAEAARNLVASGAEPIGITDCLNYGDPTKPEHFYELAESAKGITAACKALNTPVISGNVSLYNETNGEAIYPTPMIGMVGLINDLQHVTTSAFKRAGEAIFLVGQTGDDYNGTELQKLLTGAISGELFPFDLAAEKANQDLVLHAIQAGLVTAAHDLSIGGFAVALTEMALQGNLGVDVQWPNSAAQLFAETQGRFLLTVPADKVAAFTNMAQNRATQIGVVTNTGSINVALTHGTVQFDLDTARQVYEEAIPCRMK
ncbi:phosphoribosylformylglycinamidine synthase subunit PurL [Lacticaseibacillus sharpeae]|uniref:Phosphoribosylformylglycinamidine synthase subunit PurL n=1 Tax=Lacticaseibacillus sharpeae JCM 1186 = DSM 20505 TaxID=1291052 RepID=A0A0R1ZI02_9LACO|nr:phosphoribosylformylglycinamidine synthase subunit PurL [Lacticaseibacillus sharpeae]KRM54526.1 phosphoribosylformylglycinamidine synthase II [Lacticaseibacillus sharpeae JCM 1186 = DSM 20505]